MTKLLAIKETQLDMPCLIFKLIGGFLLFLLWITIMVLSGVCLCFLKLLQAGKIIPILLFGLLISLHAQNYTSPMPDVSLGMAPPQKAFSLINPNHVYVYRTNWLEVISWKASVSTNVTGYQVGYFTNFNFSLVWYLGTTTNLYYDMQATNLAGVLVLPCVRAINTTGYVSKWLI